MINPLKWKMKFGIVVWVLFIHKIVHVNKLPKPGQHLDLLLIHYKTTSADFGDAINFPEPKDTSNFTSQAMEYFGFGDSDIKIWG